MIHFIRFGAVCRKLLKSASEAADLENSGFFFLKKNMVKTCFYYPGVDPRRYLDLFHMFWVGFQKFFEKCLQAPEPKGIEKSAFVAPCFFLPKTVKTSFFFAPAWIPEALMICFIHFEDAPWKNRY